MGPSLYDYPDSYNVPIRVQDEELIFPVLILYPESSSSDFIREMAESDTFADVFYVGSGRRVERRRCSPPRTAATRS